MYAQQLSRGGGGCEGGCVTLDGMVQGHYLFQEGGKFTSQPTAIREYITDVGRTIVGGLAGLTDDRYTSYCDSWSDNSFL